ncbi:MULTISPECIES: MASE1 domain-containing protein [Protofrankia]|uniref:MASE1 domain-containing protein n=1 Tax=Protofrankia TaxID=2994361 RepID=UPI00069AED2A|nr:MULTISPECIES: MASE1 domain-containing protein [Protofrankia]ONH34730.1 hypothetical protein BL254_15015 [Protofrankia sp. BMG5.30]
MAVDERLRQWLRQGLHRRLRQRTVSGRIVPRRVITHCVSAQRVIALCVAFTLRTCAITASYYAAARAGLLLELAHRQVTPLWPPTGIAVVCLLLLGLRMWPGVALGAFLVNLSLGSSVLVALGISVGNTLAPVTACLLLRRSGFRPELDRLRDALALVFLGALAGMLVSATGGTGVLTLAGAVPTDAFWSTWSVWWTGDAMGVLVVVPFLLVLRRIRCPRGAGPHRWLRWFEAGAMLTVTAVVTLVATRGTVSLLFIVSPVLIWAAFRFQLAGAAPCALLVSVITISAAADDAGPFRGHELSTRMLTLQAFNGTTALIALSLSALVTERNRTHQRIVRVCQELTEAVARLTPADSAPDTLAVRRRPLEKPERERTEKTADPERSPPSPFARASRPAGPPQP